jgi:hypothetical protein
LKQRRPKYFNGDHSESPESYINNLIAAGIAGSADKVRRTWAYISAGIDVVKGLPEASGVWDTRGPADRWSACFNEPDEPAWDNTYITDHGLETADEKALWDGTPETRKSNLKQIASYLDTLVSLSVLAALGGLDGNGSPSELYAHAAIDVFGQDETWAQSPGQLEQKYAIVISDVTTEAWEEGAPKRASDFIDFWSDVMSTAAGLNVGYVRADSLNPDANDWDVHPFLYDSNTYKLWAGGMGRESLDRLTLRLAMVNYGVGVDESEIAYPWSGGSRLTAAAAMGATAARLGKTRGLTNDLIFLGKDPGGGVSPEQVEMVGLQFLIGMFAQANIDPGSFTHSLHIGQDPTEVIPSSTQTLDQKPKITYKLGTGFDTVTPKSPEKKAVDEQANTKALLDHFITTINENPGAQLQIRTLFQSQVTAYETVALAVPGDPLHPERQVTSTPLSTARTPISTTTKLGNTTSPTLDFTDGDWAPLTVPALEALIKGDNNLIVYNDERYASLGWKPVDPPHREETAGSVTLYQDGAVKVPVSLY